MDVKKDSTIESISFVLHLSLSCNVSGSSADAVCTTATKTYINEIKF